MIGTNRDLRFTIGITATMTDFHRSVIVAEACCYDDEGALRKKHRRSSRDDAFFHRGAIVASSQERPPLRWPSTPLGAAIDIMTAENER